MEQRIKKTLIPFGVGGVLLVSQWMNPPWYISFTILCFSIFLIVWGIYPTSTRAFFRDILPSSWDIDGCFNKFESFIGGLGEKEDPAVVQLSELLLLGRTLYNRELSSDDNLRQLIIDVNAWNAQTRDYLRDKFTLIESNLIMDEPEFMNAEIDGSYNYDHNQLRLRLNKRLEILRGIIEKNVYR